MTAYATRTLPENVLFIIFSFLGNGFPDGLRPYIGLQQADLARFAEMIQVFPHRKELVKYIWLHIQLPTYTEALSLTFEDTTAKSLNGRCIAHDLFMLFSILSSWDPDLCRLTLEVTFQSPSDSHYAFRHLNFGGKEHKTIRTMQKVGVLQAWDRGTGIPGFRQKPTLDPHTIKSYAHAVAQLDLPSGIIDPESLRQIVDELTTLLVRNHNRRRAKIPRLPSIDSNAFERHAAHIAALIHRQQYCRRVPTVKVLSRRSGCAGDPARRLGVVDADAYERGRLRKLGGFVGYDLGGDERGGVVGDLG
ncbi:hypothetical protein HG530_011127 [Fusarium avenaceum]|nr:hypothetical protein HG530_011127 [Fusarium avenaceum]